MNDEKEAYLTKLEDSTMQFERMLFAYKGLCIQIKEMINNYSNYLIEGIEKNFLDPSVIHDTRATLLALQDMNKKVSDFIDYLGISFNSHNSK